MYEDIINTLRTDINSSTFNDWIRAANDAANIIEKLEKECEFLRKKKYSFSRKQMEQSIHALRTNNGQLKLKLKNITRENEQMKQELELLSIDKTKLL